MAIVLPPGSKKELGSLLMNQGLLSAVQLTQALKLQKQSGKSLGQILADEAFVTEEDITRTRAQQTDIPYLCLDDIVLDKTVQSLVTASFAHKYGLLPVGKMPDGTLKLAVAAWDAGIMDVAGKLASAHRLRIAPFLATEAPLRAAIAEAYGGGGPGRPTASAGSERRSATPAVITKPHATPALIAKTNSMRPPEKRASDVFAGAQSAPSSRSTAPWEMGEDDVSATGVDQPAVIQFINRILSDAVAQGASDIHLEPRRNTLDIRYRQDGVLRHVDSIRHEFQAACSSRIKIMAEMNIAERRLPQDGRISVTLGGRVIDMRVSSLPTQYGESIVLRILDKNGVRPDINKLGFSARNLDVLNGLIRKPHGIFLATGPTGSGKTTTLYSAIQAIHTPDVNIITVEDPVEYELEGIRQSNVNEKAGLTFARQLRAILRQDPDIIYVGEIRDAETAEIAFRAALTGHLVFSTLHCNDAAGAITRLLNMGMDPFLVASTIVGVLAQRLVRKVCANCGQPYAPSEIELQAFGVDTDSLEYRAARFRAGSGCEECAETGYKGRCSVQELMVMDDSIRAMTLSRTPSHKIRHAAIARGMVSMRQDTTTKIMQGITTFEEAQKRVYLEEDAGED